MTHISLSIQVVNYFYFDIVRNDMSFSKYEYDTMVDIANQFGLTPKKRHLKLRPGRNFLIGIMTFWKKIMNMTDVKLKDLLLRIAWAI